MPKRTRRPTEPRTIALEPSYPTLQRSPAASPKDLLPAAFTPADTASDWQTVHDKLQSAFELGNASLDQARGNALILLNQTLDALSAELTALDQEQIHDHTLSLEAATQQLGGGIDNLKHLQAELQQIAGTFADAAKLAQAVNDGVSALSAFLATFPL